MKKIKTPLIRETIFREIRKKILFGEFKPGDKLIEMDLAEQLGVSRTPVREALHKLELEKLVKIVPRKYCLVIGLTDESIKEIHTIRAVLEPLAASKAVANITDEELEHLEYLLDRYRHYLDKGDTEKLMEINDEFHNTITAASHLTRVIDFLENLHDYVERFRITFLSNKDLAFRSLEEHQNILNALKLRDEELVHKEVENHLQGIFEYEDIILKDMKQ